MLLIVNPGGTVTVQTDPSQGPFDRNDDTLVGVVNSSGSTVNSLTLSGSGGIFGFDGDGLCRFTEATWPCPTTYEGPNTSFTVTDPNNGSVNFVNGGLPTGNSRYFSLEGIPFAVTQSCTNTCTVTDAAPGMTVTATITFSGAGTVTMVIGGTLACSAQFFHAPSFTTLTTTGVVTTDKIITLAIDKSVVVKQGGGNAGLAHYDVCYSSPNNSFTDVNGNLIPRGGAGYLASCSNTTPAPCLLSKQKRGGGVVETFKAPPNDPRFG